MRIIKYFLIYIMIQSSLMMPAVFAQENMSPAVLIDNKDLQNAFILKLENGLLYDALEENGWSINKTAKALDTYPSKIKRQVSADNIKARKRERKYILRSLERNGFSLEKTKKELGIGRKQIIRQVGHDVVKAGRQAQRDKELEIERQMVLCALEAFDWNVAKVSEQMELSISKIRELVPTEEIQRNREIMQESKKQLMVKVLEDNNWVVTDALKDQRLIEREIGRHILYNTLTVEWIDQKRQEHVCRAEQQQKQEILEAINIFIKSRSCLKDVQEYLGLARGTLNDRLRKHNINIADIRYSKEKVFPAIIQTGANLTQAAKMLGLDRQVIARRFQDEIIRIERAKLSIGATIKEIGYLPGYVTNLKQKMPLIGRHYKEADEAYYAATKFKVYFVLTRIRSFQKNKRGLDFPEAVLKKIKVYEDFFARLNNALEFYDTTYESLFSVLEIVKAELDSFEKRMPVFYEDNEFFALKAQKMVNEMYAQINLNNSI